MRRWRGRAWPAGCRLRPVRQAYLRQLTLAVAEHALRVRSVQGQPGEEFRGHAPALAGVELPARGAGARRGRLAQPEQQLRLAPQPGEAAWLAHVARPEFLVQHERAGVDVANRVDQADHAARPAQVQARQRGAERGQVEERVAGEHVRPLGQPVVKHALLRGGRVQVGPAIGAPAGRPEPGDPQARAVIVGDLLERIQLRHVLPGHDDGDLELAEVCRGQVIHRPPRHGEAAGAPDRVVDVGGRPVDGDLHVHVVGPGEPLRGSLIQPDAVGGELDAHVVRDAVVEQVPEVRAERRLAAPDVRVEHLHSLQLVHHPHAFGRAELARVAPPGRAQAVHALQVAGIGKFPGQADRRGQPALELLGQGGGSPGQAGLVSVHR